MHYQVLIQDVPNEFYDAIRYRFQGMNVSFTMALALQDMALLCTRQQFHLIILRLPADVPHSEFIINLRSFSFAPIAVLLDTDIAESCCVALQSGADLCVGTDWPLGLTVDHIMALFRRYTTYNTPENCHKSSSGDFQRGDIYIDPSRHVVRVRERSVKLRRREFLLLLYFMRNPKIILSAAQICEHAWDSEDSYAQGISGPIAILRKAIEPDPANPIYIKTVKTFGYWFTAHNSETCDIYSDSVGLL